MSLPCQKAADRLPAADIFRDRDALLGALGLEERALPPPAHDPGHFPLRVPRAFARRMRRGDPNDPLLRQVLPSAAENRPARGFGPDPVGDAAATRSPGLIHKYSGRALLLVSGSCVVHCRYCFRRHFPYGDHRLDGATRERLLDELRTDTTIREVILSGGDPLALSPRRLGQWLEALQAIGHLQRIRIHSRVPVALPERIDGRLLDVLAGAALPLVLVVHANHPAEIDRAVSATLGRIGARGIRQLNQSVLLKGVNDSPDTLCELSERLFAAGVLPYYLHQLDRVAGAAHFRVARERALELHEEMRLRLPGYLVPRLVREVDGAKAKEPLA